MGEEKKIELKFGVMDKNGNMKEIKDIGEFFETVIEDLKSPNAEHEDYCDYELEEIKPDGINIHISGTDIDKIDNINIYFKTKEE